MPCCTVLYNLFILLQTFQVFLVGCCFVFEIINGTMFPLEFIDKKKLLGHKANAPLNLLVIPNCFPKRLCQFYQSMCSSSSISLPTPDTVCILLFYFIICYGEVYTLEYIELPHSFKMASSYASIQICHILFISFVLRELSSISLIRLFLVFSYFKH